MFGIKDDRMQSDIAGLLGKGTSFEGKLLFEGTVQIDGRFTGEISTTGLLVIGDDASVSAQIRAARIIVRGEVHGNMHASGIVEIKGTGKVTGDIHTPSLTIEEGARFEGTCRMTRKKDMADGTIEAQKPGDEERQAAS